MKAKWEVDQSEQTNFMNSQQQLKVGDKFSGTSIISNFSCAQMTRNGAQILHIIQVF